MNKGLNIKFARMRKGMTQDELCEKVGICRSTLTKMENGDLNIRRSTMLKISEILEVPVTELFFSEE